MDSQYHLEGKKYTFAMNGQTGKMTGDLPVDNKAYWKWFAGITAGVAAVTFGIVSAVNVFAAAIPDTRQLPRLVDEAGLLTSGEAWSLEERLDAVSEKYRCDVAVVTTEETYGKNATEYADDFYDYNGYGFGEEDDGILLLLDMGDREWALTTYGYGITAFTDAGQAYMSEQFLPYLKEGDYAQAFETYVKLCGEFLEQAKTGEAFDKGNLPKEPLSLIWIPLSILIGAVFAFIATGYMRLQMKSVRNQKNAFAYIKDGSMRLTRSNEIYLYSNMTRTPKPKDTDSGGGGSSVHTSSSGRSHGGSSGSF